MRHLELFHGLVAAGMKMRYGSKPGKQALLRFLWEKKHIIDAGFVDYYVLAFWIFRHFAASAQIECWARGGMPSSIVCYCLGLTEIDPIRYALHSARFVNEAPPKFQFDIEANRFGEFMKGAEDMLQSNAGDFDIPAIRKTLLQDLTTVDYLSHKRERPLPECLEDEMARYALSFPQTMDLYEAYINGTLGSDIVIYQEQMMDILRQTFHVGSLKANRIRLAIQRGETEQVEVFRKEIFGNLKGITLQDAETAWQRLTSNPRAFLKAHAVSRVVSRYHYETEI